MSKLKKIITPILLFLIVFSFTGCGKKEETTLTPAEEKDILDSLKIISSKEIEDGNVVFILKNKADVDITDVVVTVEFWKKDVIEEDKKQETGDRDIIEEGEEIKEEVKQPEDKITITSNKTFVRIEPNQSVAGMVSSGKREYDYYKITMKIMPDTKTASKISILDDFELEDNTVLKLPQLCSNKITENCVSAEEMPTLSNSIKLLAKNRSDKKASYYEYSVVFYKGNTIVGYSDNSGTNLDSKKMRDVTAEFPRNSITRKPIEFDNYTIYKNLVYAKQ